MVLVNSYNAIYRVDGEGELEQRDENSNDFLKNALRDFLL